MTLTDRISIRLGNLAEPLAELAARNNRSLGDEAKAILGQALKVKPGRVHNPEIQIRKAKAAAKARWDKHRDS